MQVLVLHGSGAVTVVVAVSHPLPETVTVATVAVPFVTLGTFPVLATVFTGTAELP